MKRLVLSSLLLLPVVVAGASERPAQKSEVRLTTVPPSPFTDQIALDVRAAVRNGTDAAQAYDVIVYLDDEDGEHVLHRETVEVPARSAKGVYFRWPTRERAGQHRLIVVARGADATCRAVETIDVVKSDVPSLGRITGAWAGIVHFDDGEGERWNTDIRVMTDAQWRALIHDVHAIGMDTVVITQAFLNGNLRYGQHSMEKDGFSGRALYPSKLFPERELIASEDPIETVLASADALDMHVFLGVGIYAFFDFTPASLKWHIQVTDELYERYGHHRSLYGWYVADECPGALLSTDDENAQIAEFFRGYRAHVRTITPEMPVMMAPNSFYMLKAEKGWAAILRHLDILCPFGWNRMRKDDAQGDAVARRLQQLCDEAGAHFWMDLEVFLARRRPKPDPRYIGNPLWPRPIEEIVDELRQYPRFEKVLCFQYPGIMTAPEAAPRLGGDEAVKLYEDYRRLLESATTNPSR
ncbi:MAG: DUF4434 domain-containing protein [Phycisphaerae bacterium]|nr:DUF4434 domain-containing protein [Phycisphaerae bacterium]